MRTAAALLLVVGVLAVTESAITFAWQEPITAFFAQRDQEALKDQLENTRLALLSPGQPSQLPALAERLDRRAGAGDALGRIRIPKLGISFVFVAGAGTKSLKQGPGHYDSTVLPGQQGTVGLAGHRTTYMAPFRKLDRLRRGDEIAVTMPYGRFTYSVKGSRVVPPTEVAVLRQVGEDRLVLTTCTPLFSAAKRLVIVATKTSEMPLGAAVGDPFPYRPRS